MKWISVEFGLPGEGQFALTCGESRGHLVACLRRTPRGRLLWWDDGANDEVSGVTHWMPLPPAPTAEDDAARENRAET